MFVDTGKGRGWLTGQKLNDGRSIIILEEGKRVYTNRFVLLSQYARYSPVGYFFGIDGKYKFDVSLALAMIHPLRPTHETPDYLKSLLWNVRINENDLAKVKLEYPIIIARIYGYEFILDGNHRATKSLMMNKSIRCYQFSETETRYVRCYDE